MKNINPTNNLNQIDLADRTLRTIHPGDTVRLTHCHAHSGKTGTYEGSRRSGGLWGASVRLMCGARVMVWRNTEWVKENA